MGGNLTFLIMLVLMFGLIFLHATFSKKQAENAWRSLNKLQKVMKSLLLKLAHEKRTKTRCA